MKLTHPAIRSSLFKIIGIYEIDLALGNNDEEDIFSLRIEVSQSTSNKSLYRYKAWKNELFRVQSTFPQDQSGQLQHQASDEVLLIGYSQPQFSFDGELNANSQEEALNKIIESFVKSLEHITLIKPSFVC